MKRDGCLQTIDCCKLYIKTPAIGDESVVIGCVVIGRRTY